jgi:DNA-binding FadR family transcriptional regulator
MEQYGVSSTVVRHAVAQLQAEGVAIGHSGKAVYVQALPRDGADERRGVEQLDKRLDDLAGEVREGLGVLEANLIDLYARLGYEYPRDSATGHAATQKRASTKAARRERPA